MAECDGEGVAAGGPGGDGGYCLNAGTCVERRGELPVCHCLSGRSRCVSVCFTSLSGWVGWLVADLVVCFGHGGLIGWLVGCLWCGLVGVTYCRFVFWFVCLFVLLVVVFVCWWCLGGCYLDRLHTKCIICGLFVVLVCGV